MWDKIKRKALKFLEYLKLGSESARDARINNPGAAMIRDAYAKGDKELAKLLTDEMLTANLTGIALGSGAAPLITGFTIAPVTTGATLATGMAGGMAGVYGTDKAINYFSNGNYTGWGDWVNQATNGAIGETTAGFFHPGAIFGGLITGKIGSKIVGVTNRGKLELLNSVLNKNIQATTLQPTVADESVLRGQLGWAPKQTIPYRHGSLDPNLKTFVPKHDRWDVITHGADPNMYFVTDLSTPVSAANMMDLRPYQYTGSIVAEKPMVQVGDFNVAGKNTTRNQLIARARQQGADTYLLQDIVDNKVPHLSVVARFIGPEGEAIQGGAASIKWYGPTMGKTTAAKVSNKIVDIDPLLKPIRARHAERLGLKIFDPKVSADPLYKQEVADFVLEWRANPENQGKTLVASTKHLLDPQYKVEFANEPSIPDFEIFAARNKARGFKETDEQLRAWYNSIFELGRELNVDNRYVSDIESGISTNKITSAFKDKYGREVIPTPYDGPDADLVQAVKNAQLHVLLDYFSPSKISLLKSTLKWGDKEIAEFHNELIRALGKPSEVQIKGPADGFTIIGEHSGQIVGTGLNAKGEHTITLNRERIPNLLIAEEGGIHELGGHGKIVSMNADEFGKESFSDNAKEMFPRIAELTQKNKELAEQILEFNKLGKFLNQFKTVADLERYFIEKDLPWAKFDKFNTQRKYFLYATKSNEKEARAYTGQLYEKLHGPGVKTKNIELLERYFTPESVEKFKKAVLGISPIIGTGYLFYNYNDSNSETFQHGGKLNYLNSMGNGNRK